METILSESFVSCSRKHKQASWDDEWANEIKGVEVGDQVRRFECVRG